MKSYKGERYNGWRNYSTWATYCWLTNEEDMQRELEEKASEAQSYIELADDIREDIYDRMDEFCYGEWGFWETAIEEFLDNVDFLEIAHQFDVKEDTETA